MNTCQQTLRQTFRQWLHEQRHRLDPMGDVARDVAQGMPLVFCGAGVVRAWVEYQSTQMKIAKKAIWAAKRGYIAQLRTK